MTQEITTTNEEFTPQQVNDIMQSGDIGSLTLPQRSKFLWGLAKNLGLNPFTKPFDIISVRGQDGRPKMIVYANRTATDQLAQRDKLSVEVKYNGPLRMGEELRKDVWVVEVQVSDPNGRSESHVGAVGCENDTGDGMANAIMKASTKAKRRAILSFAGLGFLDELEVETIPKAETTDSGVGRPKTVTPPVTTIDADVLPNRPNLPVAKPSVKVR